MQGVCLSVHEQPPLREPTDESSGASPRLVRGEILPVIFGVGSTELNALEVRFFRQANPFGFILFKRNCDTPDQVRWLVRELRQAVGRDDAPILIDQEGGRVARLGPPHWLKHPPARVFGLMYEDDPILGAEAMQLYARIVAHELSQLGITVNCAPVLDLFIDGASVAIGDRALSRKPAIVAALGRIWAETLMRNGILPVIKHMPGHGRMTLDPHHLLPTIDASRPELETDDFVPFDLLKDLPIGMNSHAVFTALDPHHPASLSPIIHRDIIRSKLGFDGLLLSDDLTMKALNGAPADLAVQALAAGSDVVLHCDGDLNAMKSIAHALSTTPMSRESLARWTYAQTMVQPAESSYKSKDDIARLDMLLGAIAYETKVGT